MSRSEVPLNNSGNPVGDPPAEPLDPPAAATEFTIICEVLDARHGVSLDVGEDYLASGERI